MVLTRWEQNHAVSYYHHCCAKKTSSSLSLFYFRVVFLKEERRVSVFFLILNLRVFMWPWTHNNKDDAKWCCNTFKKNAVSLRSRKNWFWVDDEHSKFFQHSLSCIFHRRLMPYKYYIAGHKNVTYFQFYWISIENCRGKLEIQTSRISFNNWGRVFLILETSFWETFSFKK